MRQPVPVEKRVAVGLWRLATGNSYRSCGLQFGLRKSTSKVISQQFESILCERKNNYIRFPFTEDEVKEVMDDSEELYHFPQIVGAIDGSHIEIKAPPENREDYFNRKQFYSVVLQGIVDSELLFRHIAVGFPGSVHDSRVLQLSGIADLAENNEILAAPVKIMQGTEVRPLLVGDSTYPLGSWLIKPFPNRGNLLRQEKNLTKN